MVSSPHRPVRPISVHSSYTHNYHPPLTIHPSLSILHTLIGKEGEEVLQYLLSSHTNQLMVFQDSSLVWAARLDHTPADITVANFK